MNKYKELGKNSVLIFVGNFGSKLIGFIMLPLYTRWLSVSDYGITDIINVYSTLLLSIITCCIAESIFIFPTKKTKKEQKEYFTSGVFFSIATFIIAAVIFYILLAVMRYYNIDNSFVSYGWYIYFVILASFFQKYIQQFSRSINKIKIFAISGILLTICTAISAYFLIPSFGVVGYIYSQFLAMIISGIYVLIAIRAPEFFSIRSFDKNKCLEMLAYSTPLISNGVMWWLIGALNRPLIEEYVGLKDVGLYAVANKFPSLISVVFSIFILSWQVSVLQEFNKPNYKEFYNKIARIVFFILATISCLLIAFSKYLIILAADEKFIEAWKIVPLLSIAALFASFGGFVGTNFSAIRKSKYYFYSSVWGGVSSVILNFLLIPKYGLYGAALAFLGSYFCMAISRYLYSEKYVKLERVGMYCIFIIINIGIYVVNLYVLNVTYKFILCFIMIGFLFIINRDVIYMIPKLIATFRNSSKK